MDVPIQFQFKQEFFVSSADVDFQQKLRFSSLTNYLIQIAWKHAELIKWGVDDLLKYNLVWVIWGLKIQMDEMPNWRETVTIETWPKGINRLFYLRDYKIYNSNGKLIGRATSNWILIDIEKRRPKLHTLNSEVLDSNKNNHAIEELIPTLKADFEIWQSTYYNVKYSDVDLNQHLTTTRYIDLLFDMYSLDELNNKTPRELTVNFTKEVVFGQKVRVLRSKIIQGKEHFQLVSEDGTTVYFRADLESKA